VNFVRIAAILILLFATVNNASAAYGHRSHMQPTPTPALTNRGAMGQIQANALASNNGYTWRQILKYFYGADIIIETRLGIVYEK
jgi:hypothetical protein